MNVLIDSFPFRGFAGVRMTIHHGEGSYVLLMDKDDASTMVQKLENVLFSDEHSTYHEKEIEEFTVMDEKKDEPAPVNDKDYDINIFFPNRVWPTEEGEKEDDR